MIRVGATIGSAALLVMVSVAGPAQAAPSPTPPPPTPAPSSVPKAPSPVPGAPSPVPGAPSPVPPPGPAAGPLPGPAPAPADPGDDGPVIGSGNPVKDACDVFFDAGNLAASNYEDFADASEGSGNDMNYGDPEVERTSAISRVAMRQAASAAGEAANFPGVPPEVADPMRSWALHINKLIIMVTLRSGRDTVNDTVNQVNVDYGNVRQACATALSQRRG